MTPKLQGLREPTKKEIEQVSGGRISTDTFTVKVPGPTDFIVTTATNSGGNHPPGKQSTLEVSNKDAR
jgi:hypothetical protein